MAWIVWNNHVPCTMNSLAINMWAWKAESDYVLFQELLASHCKNQTWHWCKCSEKLQHKKTKALKAHWFIQMKALKSWPNKWHCKHGHGHAVALHHWQRPKKTATKNNDFCFGPSPAGCLQVLLGTPQCLISLYMLCKLTTFVVGPFRFFSFTVCRQCVKNWGQVVNMQQHQKICRLGPFGRTQNANLRVTNLDAYNLLILIPLRI